MLILIGTCGHLRAADPVDIKATFMKSCAPCHGPDGRAKTPAARKLGVKDLTLSKIPDEEITKQILNGSFDKSGKQKMPSFKETLSEEQVADLAIFVKGIRR